MKLVLYHLRSKVSYDSKYYRFVFLLLTFLFRKKKSKCTFKNGNEKERIRFLCRKHGGVAQLGERLPCKQEVRSSILLISTSSRKIAARERRARTNRFICTEKGNGLVAQQVRAHA